MCSITDMCFMCTRNNNCSLVNDRIVSQIEYLLPEITIFKLGVPLRICCACEKKLQSFNEFKNFCVGNSLRLEERIKKEQFNKDSTAQLSSSSAMKNENTSVGPNSNVEDILIKEEPCEETSYEREYYNNVVKNMTETDCATDNNENCNINNQICTKYGTEDKSAIPGTSDQQFEEIYIKPEIIEDGSMDFENCDDVLMNETRENNQNALSKSGNTSSLKTNGMSSAGISNLKDINFEVRENTMDSNEYDSTTEEHILMGTPPDTTQATTAASDNLLSFKSKNQYERQYKLFMDWRWEARIVSLSENVLLAYFQNLSTKMKPSSLWAIYSMLRMTINLKNNVDISKYPKLSAFLKRTSDGYKPQKSKTLTPEQIQEFLSAAPDEKYLFTKVGFIFGILGACRREELMKIETSHVEDLKTALLVHIRDTKTKTERQFVIGGSFYKLCKKYMELRPPNLKHVTRFFLNFQRGKCTKQPVGINKFGSLASQVAAFLKLPDSNLYTGHCFRRSSATILIDSGASVTTLKCQGGCRSTSVADNKDRVNEIIDITENIKTEISEDTDDIKYKLSENTDKKNF